MRYYPRYRVLEEIKRQCIEKIPREEIGNWAFYMRGYTTSKDEDKEIYDLLTDLAYMEEGEGFYMEYDEILARVEELLKTEKRSENPEDDYST